MGVDVVFGGWCVGGVVVVVGGGEEGGYKLGWGGVGLVG